ncbi:hypothetical protein [Leeia aquatica]|uniref:NTF2 fold immunity protein domain-containing protein n=1 Tax=Leeia aquatica TaxID=2725557 RepID=A0A847S2C8_9NEIS|nr:hypothetical protein [Leeia aquatica]NLR73894.1 hypothetical protein [Leeia aquatica]
MDDFELSRYLQASPDATQRGPLETVLAYIAAFQAWSRDCHHWARHHRERVAELQSGPARDALRQIQQVYCTLKHRPFQRDSSGYYFYGGTADANPDGAQLTQQDKRSATVQTLRRPPHAPAFRFSLKKQGQVWRICSLERLNGCGTWEADRL